MHAIMSSFKLQKPTRLQTPKQFKTVYANRQFANTEAFSFNALDQQSNNKLGITVSKKVSPLAVRRNHIKRLVREHYRVRQAAFIGVYLVITAKPAAANLSNRQIEQELDALWEKVIRWYRWRQRSLSQASD